MTKRISVSKATENKRLVVNFGYPDSCIGSCIHIHKELRRDRSYCKHSSYGSHFIYSNESLIVLEVRK